MNSAEATALFVSCLVGKPFCTLSRLVSGDSNAWRSYSRTVRWVKRLSGNARISLRSPDRLHSVRAVFARA